MVTFGENPTGQERTAEFTPLLRVKSPPEIDAKQSCRTKLYNDRLRGKNVSGRLDKTLDTLTRTGRCNYNYLYRVKIHHFIYENL